jgi:hypothetical protein
MSKSILYGVITEPYFEVMEPEVYATTQEAERARELRYSSLALVFTEFMADLRVVSLEAASA